MTLCPVAIAVGCKKCPIFSVCPAKSIIGDQKKDVAGGGTRFNSDSDQKKTRK